MTHHRGVTGQWNCGLSIGGAPFAATTSNVVALNVIETIHQNLPSLQLTIKDATGQLQEAAASGDGTPIILTLGDGNKLGSTTSQWSIQGDPDIKPGSSHYVVQLRAMLDAVPFSRSISTGLFEGTANSVLGQVAAKAGLSFKGDSTSDKQVWLPNNKTLAGFAKHIVGHAYAGKQSGFVSGVTENKQLRLLNLSTAKAGGKVFSVTPGTIPIRGYEIKSKGAWGNHNRAAGATSSTWTKEGVLTELNKITQKRFSSNFGFSPAFAKSIGELGGRLDTMIRDAGNVHEKFIDARHQNSRIRDMFTCDLIIFTDVHSGVNILDTVTAYPPSLVADTFNLPYCGNYVVTAKTRSLVDPSYVERITLTTTGRN